MDNFYNKLLVHSLPRRFLVYVVMLFLGTTVLAQGGKTYHDVFSKKEGLALDKITSLAYDNDGFLWIGGSILDVRTIVNSDKRNRLQRFNGSVFHDIYFPEREEPVLSVQQLLKRGDGKLYVLVEYASGPALYLLDPKTTKFTEVSFGSDSFTEQSLSYVFPYKDKNFILRMEDRSIWVCELLDDLSVKPLFSFYSEENKYLLDPSTVFIPFDDFCLIADDNFPIHFIDWNGNVLKKFSGETFTRSRKIHVEKFYPTNVFKKNDTVFTFPKNNTQLHYVDTKKLDIVPVLSNNSSLQNNDPFTFTDINGETLVTGTRENNFTFSRWTEKGFDSSVIEKAFSGTAIHAFSNNIKREVWVGSNKNELHYFKFPSQVIKNLLPDIAMRALCELPKNRVIIASENKGWFEYNVKNHVLQPYILSEEGQPYSPNSSRNIIADGATLWSNNFSHILEIDTTTKRVKSYRHFPVVCMEELNDSILVYGTRNYNLIQFNKHTKKHTTIIPTDSLYVYDIAIHDSFLVGATDKGLLTYDFKNRETAFYNDKEQLEDPFLLMTDYVEGVGYVTGSRDGHVGVFNKKEKEWKLVYKDPLKAGIATIIYDENRWCINTFNGMVFFDVETKSSTRFSTADGLSNNEANRYSALKTKDYYWSGSLSGLNYFSPTELAPKKVDAQLVLQKMTRYHPKTGLLETNLNQAALKNIETIILGAEQRELTLDVALTNSTTPNENRLRYRLNEGEWSALRREQSIAFANMAPGKYVLEVEASDFSGNKIGETLSVSILAKDFFYRSWWFYLLVLLFIVGLLLFFLYQSRQKQRLQERFAVDLLVSQEHERNHIAKELHDSVGQQLTLIKRKAQKNGVADIASLTNTVLEEVRGISRGLYPANLKLLGLTESIQQLVYDLDEQSDVFFSVSTDDVDVFFDKDATLNIFRFVQECLANSLKHAEATAVELAIEEMPNQVKLLISDNGRGFNVADATMQHSLGLKTLAERIKILKGTIHIESTSKQGTTINAILPKQ